MARLRATGLSGGFFLLGLLTGLRVALADPEPMTAGTNPRPTTSTRGAIAREELVIDIPSCHKTQAEDCDPHPRGLLCASLVRTRGLGTPMATRKKDLSLPLPLQLLAAWVAVWLGRVLQGEPSSPREARAPKSHVDRPGAKAAGHAGKGVGQKGVGITLRISALLTRRMWKG